VSCRKDWKRAMSSASRSRRPIVFIGVYFVLTGFRSGIIAIWPLQQRPHSIILIVTRRHLSPPEPRRKHAAWIRLGGKTGHARRTRHANCFVEKVSARRERVSRRKLCTFAGGREKDEQQDEESNNDEMSVTEELTGLISLELKQSNS
jgi:hypothetical protein